jgi:hypothetical protein
VSAARLDPPQRGRTGRATAPRGDYGSTLALTATLAFATVLALMALQLLVIHSNVSGASPYAGLINQQNQTVKTDLYLLAFIVILPLALIAGPRVIDAIAAGPNGDAVPAFAALLAGMLAAALIVVRLSGGLPWGEGVKGLLAGVLAWWALAGACTWRTARGGSWPALHRLQRSWPAPVALAALLIFGTLLCVTSSASLGATPLLLGALASAIVLIAYRRVKLPRLGRLGWVADLLVIVVVALAIPDLVVFRNPVGIPAIYFDPGVVQFQQDYILGPTNQLLGGGALLVGDPVSQYGVGLIYFVAGWFHLAPIGYGTFGFLDSLLTALFYVAGYMVLRLAGVRRLLAAPAIAVGVLAFIYSLQYFVGQLPEEGPLRFGLPMIVLLGAVAAVRLPRVELAARLAVLCALGVSAVWALEAFGYTTITYLAIVGAQAWLRVPGERRRWLTRQLALGLAAILVAHLIFALATLAGSGQLPDWGQYLAYAREFLLGGRAGSITYGFANWSPGVAVDGAALLSAAAIALLIRRRPALARINRALLVALAGSTVYSIALLSYTDNRSSTYLLAYVALPLLIAGTLWLSLLLAPLPGIGATVRRSALAGALAVVVLLLAGAWPSISTHFSRTALAHAYPGGGLRTALHRLWHPPPIDPRSSEGIRLLDRYMPARRALILLPTVPDLGTEILIRSRRSNLMPIGDPKADGLVPSVWVPRVGAALARIRAGRRLLIDQEALKVIVDLRNPSVDLLRAPIAGGGVEVEWILRALDRRFEIRPIYRDADGLIVATLSAR